MEPGHFFRRCGTAVVRNLFDEQGVYHPDVQLRRPLGGLVGGPGENTERQLEEARIERVELVLEAKAMARGERGATLQQLAAERLVQRVRLLGVDPGER
jgi:hypothetical protein